MGGKLKPLILLGLGIFMSLAVSIFAYNWLQGEAQKKKVVIKMVSPPPAAVVEPEPAAPVGGIAESIKPGKRAMAVKVDELSGVAGFIGPGDLVDVVVTILNPVSPDTKPERISKTVLGSIPVLATGKETRPRMDKETPQAVTVIILEVTPEEGEKLTLAAHEGNIRLALCNPLASKHVVATRGARIESLIGTRTGPKGISEPIVKKEVVELIAGEQMSKCEFQRPVTGSSRK